MVKVELEILLEDALLMFTGPAPEKVESLTVSGIAIPPMKKAPDATPEYDFVPEIVTFTISVGRAELIAQLLFVMLSVNVELAMYMVVPLPSPMLMAPSHLPTLFSKMELRISKFPRSALIAPPQLYQSNAPVFLMRTLSR